MPTDQNPAQISIPVPSKSPTAGLLYNDFACGFGLSRPQFVKHQLSESMKITWQVMLIFKKGQLPTWDAWNLSQAYRPWYRLLGTFLWKTSVLVLVLPPASRWRRRRRRRDVRRCRIYNLVQKIVYLSFCDRWAWFFLCSYDYFRKFLGFPQKKIEMFMG